MLLPANRYRNSTRPWRWSGPLVSGPSPRRRTSLWGNRSRPIATGDFVGNPLVPRTTARGRASPGQSVDSLESAGPIGLATEARSSMRAETPGPRAPDGAGTTLVLRPRDRVAAPRTTDASPGSPAPVAR